MSRFAPAMATLLMSGCAVGPNYRPATPSELAVPASYRGAQPTEAWPDSARWWLAFNDPALAGLIDRARTNNLDITQAAARLRQARELAVQAGAAKLPTVGASGSVGRNFNTQPAGNDVSSFGIGVDAQWNVDLFGALSRQQQASRASLEAAGFNLANIQTSVAAEVARNYVDARVLAARIAIAEDTLATQRNNFEIAGFREQAGLVSGLDAEQARAQLAQTAATIPPLRQSEAAARYRIAVLTGQAPGAADGIFTERAPIPPAPAIAATGIPVDLLRQRPDVRAAERNLIAATAQIGVAQAQLYPSLTLTGSIGSQATSMRTLTDIVTGNVFAQLAQTIFDGGRLRSVVRQRRAQADESFAAYKGTVLGALEDVENALVASAATATRVSALSEQADAANAASMLARANYRTGLIDFRTLLETERTLLQARDGLAAAKGDQAAAAIQLYLALGGGWDSQAPITDPTNDRR